MAEACVKNFYPAETFAIKPIAIFRDKHDKNFTIVGNETLKTHIQGDCLSAYEIHKFLLTLPPTFKPKTKWICEKFGVSKDVIGPKMTLLCKAGLASPLREIDQTTKKIKGHYWRVYESRQEPQRENDRCGSIDENPHEIRETPPKSHNRENDVVAPYIDQEYKYSRKKNISKATPPPEPGPPPEPKPPKKQSVAAAAVDNFRKHLPPWINFRINNSAVMKIIGISDDHINWAASEAMQSRYPTMRRKIGLFIRLCNEEMPPIQSPLQIPMVQKNDHLTIKENNISDNQVEYDKRKNELDELCRKISSVKPDTIRFNPMTAIEASICGGIHVDIAIRALSKLTDIDVWKGVILSGYKIFTNHIEIASNEIENGAKI